MLTPAEILTLIEGWADDIAHNAQMGDPTVAIAAEMHLFVVSNRKQYLLKNAVNQFIREVE